MYRIRKKYFLYLSVLFEKRIGVTFTLTEMNKKCDVNSLEISIFGI